MVPQLSSIITSDSGQQSPWLPLIWQYCELSDILSLSASSKRFSRLVLSSDVAQQLINKDPRTSKLDPQFLDLSRPTLGALRVMLYRLIVGVSDREALLDPSGSVLMGTLSDCASQESEEVFVIEKHLESSSFDEYDDFNPRHPDYKSHRRGGSFFNSDISDVAAQVVAEDLSLIAKLALDSQDEEDTAC
mmetsp:Transcript_12273/g.18598  ORF Transcript_12273/g.18598 Transcript_12273/m.18598 type:complete len:190 (-) Transcript_12273:241-810(-)|eukprot:CAMPEP_0185025234 /NCGR_PEP_ID=MMETSP1103-20130426/8270_1 /TAXON_ID=36769 /ORGANISM="Paraphysomonas bandaiensis, Strain Caron Lab Isolate" /LENGTH=189 /DNA_ID=CAMNT_0027558385 /DNA_START=26 /DNA_END=595 /DNA_ORIENTATION=+